jgi:DNA polymerase-1
MYIPDHDDFAFGQLDYSGAELWVMATVSNDPVMLADLREGDLHGIGAKAVGCERKTFKAVIFGTMYGAGPSKISETIRKQDGIFIPVSECKRIQGGLARRYNVMWAFRQSISNAVVARGWIKNPFGRARFYYNGTKDIPSALDYIPQSTVADILWSILKPVAECAERYGGRLTTTVHDSVLIQCPNDRIRDCIRECKAIMEREFPQVARGFKIPVECELGGPGVSWGELIKWNSKSE